MVKAEFSGEDRIFAPAAEGRAQESLGAAKIAIGVGGVDEIDAGIDRGIDDGLGLFGADLRNCCIRGRVRKPRDRCCRMPA